MLFHFRKQHLFVSEHTCFTVFRSYSSWIKVPVLTRQVLKHQSTVTDMVKAELAGCPEGRESCPTVG